MMRGNTWRSLFFSKRLTCLPFASECVCWFNLDVLFIYSKENCIIWYLLVISAIHVLDFVSSSVPAVLEYRQYWNTGFFKQVHAPTYPLLVEGR